MNKAIIITFVCILTISFNAFAASEVLFFPKGIDHRDGYRVNPDEWISLSADQKKTFVIEGIREIGKVEVCFADNIEDTAKLVNNLDKTMQVLAENGSKTAAIGILFRILYESGHLKCSNQGISPSMRKIGDYITKPVSPAVELLKVYGGYTDFYEKNGGWFMGKRPPKIGEICEHFIYSDYIVFPSGKVIVAGNYPLNFSYKIRSIKEINSFMQDGGFMRHYYEVTFECVAKQ